jgi:hypothetical protein
LEYHAYIRADPREDPEVIQNLKDKLVAQNIRPIVTEQHWKNIQTLVPFLYFRNPYIRFDGEEAAIKYLITHPKVVYLKTQNHDIVGVSPQAYSDCSKNKKNEFILKANLPSGTYYHRPAVSALPILLGTHSRPIYLQLTLNALMYSLRMSGGEIYIVASQPDAETIDVIKRSIINKYNLKVHAVVSENNLCYSFPNFGAKFFGLERFIHFEDDGILPEHASYHLPFWTRQFHHRHNNSDFVGFRIFEGNWAEDFYRTDFKAQREILDIPADCEECLWYYTQPTTKITPIGGNGLVIDSRRTYRNFEPPHYSKTDSVMVKNSNLICIANIPVYHIGANMKMDYSDYFHKKNNSDKDTSPLGRYQKGFNLVTKEEKTIDLQLDWEAYS